MVINICDTFFSDFWGSNTSFTEVNVLLTKPSTIYDNCGFKPDSFWNYFNDTNHNNEFIIPSYTFKNLADFLKATPIPFFENYTINIINTTLDSVTPCFLGDSYFLKIPNILIIYMLIFFTIL